MFGLDNFIWCNWASGTSGSTSQVYWSAVAAPLFRGFQPTGWCLPSAFTHARYLTCTEPRPGTSPRLKVGRTISRLECPSWCWLWSLLPTRGGRWWTPPRTKKSIFIPRWLSFGAYRTFKLQTIKSHLKTVGNFSKATDGQFGINVGKRQASWITDPPYHWKLIGSASSSASGAPSGKRRMYKFIPVQSTPMPPRTNDE